MGETVPYVPDADKRPERLIRSLYGAIDRKGVEE
jgi:hypothetical protein